MNDILTRKTNKWGFAIVLMAAVNNGIWPSATRGVYADGGNVIFVLLVTTWVRALLMSGFCAITQRRLFQTREATRQALIGGIFQSISVVGMIAALQFLPGPLVIIIVFSHTLMLLFYLAWRGERKLDGITLASTCTALVGLTFVLDLWHAQPASNIIGFALAFASALATVSRLYVYGQQTKTRHPIIVGAESYLIAALLITLGLFWQMPHMPQTQLGWNYLALAAVVLAIGTFSMFYGISMLGAFRWSLFLKLEPVFTALFSVLILHELLKLGQYLGMAVVIVSLVSYQIFDYRRS